MIGEYCSNSHQNDFRYSRGSPIQTPIRNTSKICDLFKEHKIVTPTMPNLIMTTPNSQKLASLAKDLTKDYPRSPRDLLAGYIIAARTLDKCRAFLNNSIGEYHFDCPLDNMFFGFAGITSEQFKEFVSTGAEDEEIAAWIVQHAQPRERIEIIKWNNDLRYKRLSELPDSIQEFMEDYIPQFVPAHLRHHIDYFFDIYDAEEKRMET